MKHNRYGFTIVELLIVIVVIGILAAISIVAYNNVSNKAHDSTVEADLSNAAKQIGLVKAEKGNYPISQSSDFPIGFKFSKSAYKTDVNNAMYCVNHNTDKYALGVTSKSGKTYLLTEGGVQKDVNVAAEAVCGAVGTGWTTPTATRSAIHGFHPFGTTSNYIDGWNAVWTWTK